jgi:hypothetical protein
VNVEYAEDDNPIQYTEIEEPEEELEDPSVMWPELTESEISTISGIVLPGEK